MVTAVLAAPVLAAKEIMGIEAGGFTMIVVSVVVLLRGVPVAARIGNSQTAVFRRVGVLYGVVLVGILGGAFLIIKQVH